MLKYYNEESQCHANHVTLHLVVIARFINSVEEKNKHNLPLKHFSLYASKLQFLWNERASKAYLESLQSNFRSAHIFRSIIKDPFSKHRH